MRRAPKDIFSAEDSEFYSGFSEDLDSDLDPQYEEQIAGADYFDAGDGDFDSSIKEPGLEFEYIDESLQDIDFSQFNGDLKSSLKQLDGQLKKRKPSPKKVAVRKKKKPLSKTVPVKTPTTLHGKATHRTIDRVLIPRDRETIVEGANRFMLSQQPDDDSYKNIGFYKGEKLSELILIFNNNSALDFNLELFNPSMPLDYLYSTSGNINNKIMVAGGTAASYTDVLFHMLANPTMILNGRFRVSGPSAQAQTEVTLGVINKNIKGEQFINPLAMSTNLDTMQFQSTVLNFDIAREMGRPLIPDGMETLSYTVLAGNTVTFCFYYKQKLLRKQAFAEARLIKTLKVDF